MPTTPSPCSNCRFSSNNLCLTNPINCGTIISMKTCTKCFESKPISLFAKLRRGKDGTSPFCKACAALYRREWGYKHPGYFSKMVSKHANKLRQHVINGYGGECVCCKERNSMFLVVDHVNNDGNIKRKLSRHMEIGANLYRRLIQDNFPSDYQLLCYNCNMGKRLNLGVCPHRTDDVAKVPYKTPGTPSNTAV